MSKTFDQEYFRAIEKASTQERTKQEFNYILSVVAPSDGESVLDVGCGTGAFGKTIIEQNAGVKVFFSDISPTAKDYLAGLNFFCSPAEVMPFADETFDKIYCLHTISHVVDREKVARELLRITKKGGQLVIIGPNRNYVFLMRLALLFGRIPSYNFDKTAKWLLTQGGVRRLLSENGWEVVKVEYFGHYIKKLLAFNFLGLRVLAVAKK
jgi:ubiquinone/menaquinone biosynthesis C-methylase UbiE